MPEEDQANFVFPNMVLFNSCANRKDSLDFWVIGNLSVHYHGNYNRDK